MAAKEWLAELLPVPYYHVVFTLPAPIVDIAYQNEAVIYDALFKAAAETLITIAADPKHLGARTGLTAVLHGWGSALTHHPHVHIIVPGGGIALDEAGVTFRWKDYRAKGRERAKRMTLAIDEFIRRFLLLADAPRTSPERASCSMRRRRRTSRRRRRLSGGRGFADRVSVPLLRRSHGHHRELRTRRRTATAIDHLDPDRYLMIVVAHARPLESRRRRSHGHGEARPSLIGPRRIAPLGDVLGLRPRRPGAGRRCSHSTDLMRPPRQQAPDWVKTAGRGPRIIEFMRLEAERPGMLPVV